MKSPIFEELDYENTPLGEISLRKRSEPRLNDAIIYEVKLGDEFLMSSLFVEAEEQLTKLALKQLKQNGHHNEFDVVVGGLGLGYTALAALDEPELRRLRTIDVMAPVIRWHRLGLLPIGTALVTDPRSELLLGDFFSLATDEKKGMVDDTPVHAILLDIDHSPSHHLNPQNSQFYNHLALEKMKAKIIPGGVFGLWSNERRDAEFNQLLSRIFSHSEAHLITFPNPYSGGESFNSVYIASI